MTKKTAKGDHLGFFKIHPVQKYSKKLKVGPFGEKKLFDKKVSQSRKYSLALLSFLKDIKILLRELRIIRN